MPVAAWLSGSRAGEATLALLVAILVFARHRENLSRLLRGEEPRLGSGGRG
jgi:glycerol-3-phosphate acyltransferase PlsY